MTVREAICILAHVYVRGDVLATRPKRRSGLRRFVMALWGISSLTLAGQACEQQLDCSCEKFRPGICNPCRPAPVELRLRDIYFYPCLLGKNSVIAVILSKEEQLWRQ